MILDFKLIAGMDIFFWLCPKDGPVPGHIKVVYCALSSYSCGTLWSRMGKDLIIHTKHFFGTKYTGVIFVKTIRLGRFGLRTEI